MTDDLVQWLGEQLDEDERVAWAATPGPWQNAPTARHHATASGRSEEAVFASPPELGATVVATTGEAVERRHLADAEHIAAHDPARVLREIDAKRRIIEQHLSLSDRGEMALVCSTCDVRGEQYAYPCPTLRLLALPYEDRPGYQEVWRP
ncbi:DUF6221 family protein [Streptomyces sp. NBC_00006]|uniref:DUF6221 family protein n=1 Tax=Streptomyces sp. NBC_00006 TaxID=2975619 RepID=UPI00225252A1|nr:DUF6221 family protein [Streptomyces sp. NBC_00006]MCX5537700.1 DUF6221 family protein [Streptomyces sp. NBC_00006]MCX5537889.1 DUF6221 family protein [Streptomyces sp. NBC_00006]